MYLCVCLDSLEGSPLGPALDMKLSLFVKVHRTSEVILCVQARKTSGVFLLTLSPKVHQQARKVLASAPPSMERLESYEPCD